MWFAYAIIAALITGVGQMLVKKGQIELTPFLDNVIAALLVNLILAPLLLLWGVHIHVGRDILFYALVAATMYATFYYIISFGAVSIMVSLINTFPIVTILLAIIFLHEVPNIVQWAGIIIVLSGFFCISQSGEADTGKKTNKNWVLWGLLGACAIGIAEFVTKVATLHTDGFTFTFYVYLMYIPPVFLFSLLDKKGRKFGKLKKRSTLLFTIVGILCIEFGLVAIALAYQHGLASLVSPVVATHMLITAILAAYFLKEKLLPLQKAGIILTIIGVSVIGICS